jgi:hypothetical protein
MAGPIGNLLAQSGWEGLLGSPIGISRLCSISMGPANSLGLFDDDWVPMGSARPLAIGISLPGLIAAWRMPIGMNIPVLAALFIKPIFNF